jgi:Do/DeqQ family serine protease
MKKAPLATMALVLALALLLGGLGQVTPAAAKFSRETPVVVAVRKAGPAVVNVSCEQVVEGTGAEGLDPFLEGFFRDFFEPRLRRKYTLTSLGSGVIIDAKRGYIVTNEHVVRGATGIKVVLSDNRTVDATLVGSDPDFDLAVLKVDPKGGLHAIPMGNSESLLIGETVIAIGNPFGFSHSVTTGVVSATHRSIKGSERVYSDFIQTDASINPGNSGGPLLNINGELIGVNTAIYAKAQGIGFAIPINRVNRICHELIEHGKVVGAWLGLEVQEGQGPALVSYVNPDGPAARGGVRAGDAIVTVNGQAVKTATHYRQIMTDHTRGEKISLKLKRGGGELAAVMTATAFPVKEADPWAWRRMGLQMIDLTAQMAKSLHVGKAKGALIKSVRSGSPAAKVGLAPGDIVKRMGDARVTSLSDFRKAVADNSDQEQLSVLIQRGQFEGYVDLSF